MGIYTSEAGNDTLSNWKFKEKYVRADTEPGLYAGADSTLICAGPASITGSGNEAPAALNVTPIGYLENFTIQQSKQLQRLFEIGSQRSYFIPGRVMGSISLGRVYYHGSSLMRMLYNNYINPADDAVVYGGNGVTVEPGSNSFWLNLASDVFNVPHGMAMFFKNAAEQTIGASYIENNYIQGHQLSISAGSVLIMEGASCQYDRLVPIAFSDADEKATPTAGAGDAGEGIA
jgi:hypothetical protein